MAHSQSHSSILEQPRHLWLPIGAALILLAVLSGFLLWRPREQVATHAYSVPVVQGRITVEVLNGTRRQGAARTATRMLRGEGIDVVFLGNADSVARATQVIARRGDSDRARYVASVLGAGKVVVETDTFRRVDVSVILGDDFSPSLPLHP